jgi:DNA-binding NarL/FixJ family response regulator
MGGDHVGTTPARRATTETRIEDSDSNPRRTAQVLAVDDQPAFRRALRSLVAATPTLALVGEAGSGEAAVVRVRDLSPDLVLMDVRMPGLDGISATCEIKRIRPETVVLLITTVQPDELRHEAVACRADGIVWKANLCPKLLADLWASHAGRVRR